MHQSKVAVRQSSLKLTLITYLRPDLVAVVVVYLELSHRYVSEAAAGSADAVR
jgi:hypothetical protein